MRRAFHFVICILVSLYVLFAVFVCSVLVLIVSPSYQRRKGDLIIKGWAKELLRACGITCVIHGLEKVPADTGCLYLINHTTLMDIPLAHAALPPSIRFGAKAELFKIPVFGRALQRIGVLKIQRTNRTAVMRVYDSAADRLRAGESFVLAPHGTRETESQLGEFKTGPFVLAINAQVPVVPVILTGIEPILPKAAWHICYRGSPQARVDVLAPISTKGMHLDQRDDLRTLVFEKMKVALEEIRKQTSLRPDQGS